MPSIPRVTAMALGLTVAVACLTALWNAMRAVLDVGGFCADGGPYQIQTHCPQGTAAIMTLSIPLGLLALGVYAVANAKLPGPDLLLLAWPALFISMGYNFLDAALHPPPGYGSGDAIAWIVCGVLFILMGAAPLLLLLRRADRRSVLWAHEPTRGPAIRLMKGDATVFTSSDVDVDVDAGAQASPPLFVVQMLAIVAGLWLGSWVATSLLG